MHIDLVFSARSETLSSDHSYDLYAAISRLIPRVHEPGVPIRIGGIRGEPLGNGLIRLDPDRARLRFRLPTDEIPTLLPLAGKSLEVGGHRLRLGVPQVEALTSAPTLYARMVVMKASSSLEDPMNKQSRDRAKTKRYQDPAEFLEAVRRELTAMGIGAAPDLPKVEQGPHAGKPRRRVLMIKGKRIVGFSVLVTGLNAEESIRLQEAGLGGRSKMGCGFFVPVKEEKR